MERLNMPEGSKEILDGYIAAHCGGAYWKSRDDHAFEAWFGSMITGCLGAFTVVLAKLAWNVYVDDPFLSNDVHSQWLGVFLGILSVAAGILTFYIGVLTLFEGRQYFQKVFGKQYASRRMPEEERTIQDKLTLVTVELSRQVNVFNQLVDEIELQQEMVNQELPTDMDLTRGRLVAGALRTELEPKLRQLDVLIKRRNRHSSTQLIDLAAMREILGDRHRDVLAELKTQQELGGDPAVSMLHQAILNDRVSATLGDPSAIARQFAAKRQRQ